MRFLSLLGANDKISDNPTFNTVVERWIRGEFKTLSIKSPMGTGKSTLLNAIIQRFLGIPILVVTDRQTLAIQQERTLANHGFVNYLDDKDGIRDREKYPRLICQVESLWRLGAHVRFASSFGIVIIDEVESVLRHHASSFVKNPVTAMNLLTAMLKTTTHGIITMDAFWGQATHDFLRNEGLSNQLIVNDYKPAPRTFSFTNDVPAWQNRIMDDLANGLNVVLVSLSTDRIAKVKTSIIPAGKAGRQNMVLGFGTYFFLKVGLFSYPHFFLTSLYDMGFLVAKPPYIMNDHACARLACAGLRLKSAFGLAQSASV
jgi:hypothetical protein